MSCLFLSALLGVEIVMSSCNMAMQGVGMVMSSNNMAVQGVGMVIGDVQHLHGCEGGGDCDVQLCRGSRW